MFFITQVLMSIMIDNRQSLCFLLVCLCPSDLQMLSMHRPRRGFFCNYSQYIHSCRNPQINKEERDFFFFFFCCESRGVRGKGRHTTVSLYRYVLWRWRSWVNSSLGGKPAWNKPREVLLAFSPEEPLCPYHQGSSFGSLRRSFFRKRNDLITVIHFEELYLRRN